MGCIRCDGFLVTDEFVDLREVNGPMEFQGMRCINCGYIGDAVILANRLPRPAPYLTQPVGNYRMDGVGAGRNEPNDSLSVYEP